MEEERKTEVSRQTAATDTGRVERQTVRTNQTIGGSLLAQRIVYYVGGAITAIIAIRFILFILGASQASGFVNFIYGLSGIFVAPFNGIFTRPVYGHSAVDSASLVALVVYAIVTSAIARLLTLNKKNRDVE